MTWRRPQSRWKETEWLAKRAKDLKPIRINKTVVGGAYLADTVDKSTSHYCTVLYSNVTALFFLALCSCLLWMYGSLIYWMVNKDHTSQDRLLAFQCKAIDKSGPSHTLCGLKSSEWKEKHAGEHNDVTTASFVVSDPWTDPWKQTFKSTCVWYTCVHVSALYLIGCLQKAVHRTAVNLFALSLNYSDLCLTWSSVPAHATLIQINLCAFPHEVTPQLQSILSELPLLHAQGYISDIYTNLLWRHYRNVISCALPLRMGRNISIK